MVWIGEIPLYTHYRTQLSYLFRPKQERRVRSLCIIQREGKYTNGGEDKISEAMWPGGQGGGLAI